MAFVAAGSAFADEVKKEALNPETVEAAKELMRTLEVREQIEPSLKNVTNMQKAMFAQMEMTEEVRARAEKSVASAMKEMEEMMAWEKLEPMMVKVYASVFTADELKRMDAFFKSEDGQVFVKKQPALQQAMMTEMGAFMAEIMPKLQEKIKAAIEEAQAAK